MAESFHERPALRLRGAGFALLATLIWSGNFVIARAVVGHVPPLTLAALRWSGAAIILLLAARKAYTRDLPAIKARFGYYILAALTGVSIYNPLLYMAGHSTATLNMSLVATTTPMFVLLMARLFFKERLSVKSVIGILAAVLGIVLLAARGNMGALRNLTFYIGDIYTLISAFIFALYTVVLRYRPAGIGQPTFLTVIFTLGALPLLPFMFWELAILHEPFVLGPTAFGCIAYIILGPSIACYWLWNKAVEDIGPGNASILYYTLPLFSGVGAVVLLGEPVHWFHWAGGMLIICGILFATTAISLRRARFRPGR